ncbi:MBOAT family O-acyltransferase [Aliarcobacter butzleri]|uniref:D-alanyl transfer protein n=3 Tax=Aliarcobacter butzleri TaxID=28197 RepID=A0A837JD60_9BACT|nr:MBOAT family O-acyltransferase [Aliarcobacter butzleri]AGR77573.1 D-alanyl transfer protein [Aliarcobacter butzleri 7h1h]KLE00695.1 D-alanyl transfer protein [Aliarcobacter butzleri L348]KLE05504.1 D-alanyl transfer protein [Aliarcobacter butzleri L352]KLE08420.1 D-alanyl transfer protein [Aliarcobacter butzleri L354]MBF7065347.1 D-alanyl transfer protein [Aliarcobacter butzleri]
MEDFLPFSGIGFFAISFIFILFLHLFKNVLKKFVSYKTVIFLSVVIYIAICIPHSYKLFLLLFYVYIIYIIFVSNNYQETIFPMIVIAFPMILHKVDIDPIFKIIGISYITFRTIQAIVDSQNYGKLSFMEFTSFLLFPTTLLAGPIDRSYRFQEDLKKGYENLTLQNVGKGWDILIVGVLFKFVIAQLVAMYWLAKIDENSTNFLDMANSAYSYTTYLFFDFAGYSAMAVGLSFMIGIFIPMNFNHPYLAPNPQDFWRRFHITLGTWLTDYFFKPLYKYLHKYPYLKNRKLLLQNIAITCTFLLMGMWNGLTWYFIFSGFLFGIYSSIHNAYVLYVKKGGYDYFSFFPEIISINLKRFLMINGAVFALYFFSGRVPL